MAIISYLLFTNTNLLTNNNLSNNTQQVGYQQAIKLENVSRYNLENVLVLIHDESYSNNFLGEKVEDLSEGFKVYFNTKDTSVLKSELKDRVFEIYERSIPAGQKIEIGTDLPANSRITIYGYVEPSADAFVWLNNVYLFENGALRNKVVWGELIDAGTLPNVLFENSTKESNVPISHHTDLYKNDLDAILLFESVNISVDES